MNWHVKYMLLGLVLFCYHNNLFSQPDLEQTLKNQLSNSSITQDSAANICRQLTRIYAKKRAFKEALVFANKEASYWENQTHQPIKLAESYFNIASLNRTLASYSTALEYAHKALSLYQTNLGEKHEESLSINRFLAQIYYFQKDYNKAIPLAQKTYLAYSKLKPRRAIDEINLQMLLGSIYNEKADYPAAQKAFLYAQELYEQFENNLSQDLLARIYNNLATVKLEQKAIFEALTYYQKALALRTALQHQNDITLQKNYTNIGVCYYRLNDFERALSYYRKSLAMLYQTYGEKHDLVAFCHNHIGATFYRLEQVDSAQYHLLKSIQIYKQVLGQDNANSIAPLWHLAKLFRLQTAYSKSEASLKKCLAIQKLHFGQYHPDLAKMYLDMAYICEFQQQYSKALFFANKAYQTNLPKQLPLDKNLMLGIIEAQLRISLQLPDKELAKAFPLLDKIQPMASLAQANLNYQMDKQNFIQNLRKVCEQGIELSYKLYQLNPQKIYLEKVFQLIEYNKAVLLSIQVKQEYWQDQKNDEEAMDSTQQSLWSHIQFLEQQWKRSEYNKDSTKAQQLQQALFEAYQHYEQIHTPIQKQLTYHSPVALTTFQKQLPDNQVVLNYFYGNKHLYMLSILQKQVHILQTSLDFEEDLNTFSTYLLDLDKSKLKLQASCQKFDQAAHLLYQHLLPQSDKKLLIIPDKQLSYLPFEALVVQKNPSAKGFHELNYALQRHQIGYAYSATSYYYQQFKHLNQRDIQILGFAPNYQGHHQLQALKANVAEVQFLEKEFAGLFYYNQKAKKTTFQAQSPHFGLVHLATHAHADQHELQQAQLFFSTTSDSLNMILHPHEIRQLPFQADFVVLSACQTAIGYWQKGEGIMSLARDFMYAGVPSILTTLWQINDQTSSLIIQDFYHHLKNLPKDEALQLAKQAYLQKASSFTAHPYFWSAFILLGNSNRLDFNTASSINLYYLAASFFLLLFIVLYGIRYKYKSS